MFPFQGVRGALFHALAGLVPWLALWTAWGLLLAVSWGAARRGWRESQARPILGGALATLLLLGGVSFTVDLRRRWEPHVQAYRAAGAWLDAHAPPGARLMGVDPPGLWYATGRIVVATPSDGPQALLRAAATYGVDYVLVQPFSPPYLAPLYDDQAPLPGLQHVADAAHLRLYRVVSAASGAPEGPSQTEMDSVSSGREGRQQLRGRRAQEGVTPGGGQLGQGHQDEAPLVQAGVGHLHLRLRHHHLAVGEDVHVHHARAPAPGGNAPQRPLGALRQAQQVEQGEAGLPLHHQVEEGPLVAVAPGRGLVDGGAPEGTAGRLQGGRAPLPGWPGGRPRWPPARGRPSPPAPARDRPTDAPGHL